MNILNARMLAMDRAIRSLKPAPDYALIDGNRNKGISLVNETVVKGDSRSASIAAGLYPGKGEPGSLYGGDGAAVS